MKKSLSKDYISSIRRALYEYHRYHQGKWPDIICITTPFYYEVQKYLEYDIKNPFSLGTIQGIPVETVRGDDPNFFLAERGEI